MNLNEIIQSAQGGQAIDNLAQQFGLSSDQAQAAVQSLLPSLSSGLQASAQSPGGLGDILGHLVNGQHQAAYQDPNAAQSDATAQAGNDVLGQLFGSSDVAADIAGRASEMSGISPDVLQQMLPVVSSIVMGGLFTQMHNQGFGGMFSELGQIAAQSGGLGGLLGGLSNQAQQAQQGGGGFGGLVGGLLGGFLGGQGSPQQAGGLDPAALQAGLSTLTNMFHHGTS